MFNFGWLWPYAAKPAIQHEFDTDHLNVWLTFRLPMDILATPPLTKWTCTVDTVNKTISSSVWQDTFTLLLTVDDVLALPDRVLVKYTGPHYDLRTTWHKQWEPWGDILSLDITT